MHKRKLYLDKISPFIDKPLIKVVSGLRRCGKSTFIKMVMERLAEKKVPPRNVVHINMELMEFEFITDHRELYRFVKGRLPAGGGRKYLFIDEVQEIPGWEKAVGSLLAEKLADIYLTGSNSRLLSSEFATLLTGRYVQIPMFTLGFKEFLQFRGRQAGEADEQEFELYLKYGGLPGIHDLTLADEVIFQYIDAIYSTIMLKDIVARYRIRDVFLLEKISAFVFDNCGSITSAKKIADYLKSQRLKCGVETVQNYIGYLQDAHLVHKARRFDLKGKRHLEFYEKYYPGDIGIRHGVLGYRQQDIAGLLESVVHLELLRRGYTVAVGKFDDLEVDFVAEKNGRVSYIQVAYLLATGETEEREFRPLAKIPDNYPKMVLSMDKVWGEERDGIIRKNLIDFLLEQDQ